MTDIKDCFIARSESLELNELAVAGDIVNSSTQIILHGGEAIEVGMDNRPRPAKIVSDENGRLMLRWPGHRFWAGRGETGYARAHTTAYTVTERERFTAPVQSRAADGWMGRKEIVRCTETVDFTS